MRVILVAIHDHRSPQAVPLANAFLKAYLAADEELSSQTVVSLHDYFLDQAATSCVTTILEEKPDAVGFSMYLWNRDTCRAIATALRREHPDLTIFAGGPEPTGDPAGVLEDAPYDFLILGEGEIPFLEIIGRLSAGEVIVDTAGIVTATTAKSGPSSSRPVHFLDTIPSPFLSGALEIGNYRGILWQLARGCDFACDFCFDQQGKESVRRFSLERVKAELVYFVRHKVSQVYVLDSTFNRDMKRAKSILRLIREMAPHVHFHFEIRSEFLDAEMARLFADITCSLQIGLQSADSAVNKTVGRHFDRADFDRKIAFLNDSGAIFGFDLIYGLPSDTLSGFAASLDFAIGLFPNHLDIFPLAVLPGTGLASKAGPLHLCHLAKPPYTVLKGPGFPVGDMRTAAGIASGCDIFYSRGKAVAWFNAVLTPLEISPSAFFLSFWRWLKRRHGRDLAEADLTDEDIWLAQRAFVKHRYTAEKLNFLLPAAFDLIDYHYHYAAALMAPVPEIPTDRDLGRMNYLAERFVLAPGARLVRFNFDIFDILEAGDIDLHEFAACFTPTGSFAVIYPARDEVFTESLIPSYYRLLKHCDGESPAGPVAVALGISAEEAISFLEFAQAEGIVCRIPP